MDASTVTRAATLTRGPSDPISGTPGKWYSDSGFSCEFLEKPWNDNEPHKSCIPPGRYLCLWQWSEKHGCNLYHLQNVPGRTVIEIHGANVQEQLLGCGAPGIEVAHFAKDSIKPGIPSQDCIGVSESKTALALLEKDMQDKNGNQMPFWLTIQ